MKISDFFQLPALDIPAGVPADHVEAWKSPDGALGLAERYSNAYDETPQGPAKARAGKLKKLASEVYYYVSVRAKAQHARETIAADSSAAESALKERVSEFQKATKEHQSAVDLHAATKAKIQRLRDQLGAAPVPGGAALATAQDAFDKVMVSGKDEARHAAAVALHHAQAEDAAAREAAVKARGPIELLIRAHQDIEATELASIHSALAKVSDAAEHVHLAKAKLALVAYDDAIYQAACAWGLAWGALQQCQDRRAAPMGFDSPAFLFASRRRSPARNSRVSGDWGPDSPILLDRLTLNDLQGHSQAPDLRVFAQGNAPEPATLKSVLLDISQAADQTHDGVAKLADALAQE